MVANIFFWWYSEGIVSVAKYGSYATSVIGNFFSLSELVKTWTRPWKDDGLAARNASLSDQLKILQLNFASRFVGFTVRSIVIFFTLIVMLVVWLGTLLSLTLWMVLPWLPIILPIIAIGMIGR